MRLKFSGLQQMLVYDVQCLLTGIIQSREDQNTLQKSSVCVLIPGLLAQFMLAIFRARYPVDSIELLTEPAQISFSVMCQGAFWTKQSSLELMKGNNKQYHYYQGAWTLVGAGIMGLPDTRIPMREAISSNAEWIKDSVASFDPLNNKITTVGGKQLNPVQFILGCLVIAPFIQLENYYLDSSNLDDMTEHLTYRIVLLY
ncbi:hypothetical protein ACTXT7_007476 [Hymenolepis weldensis]